MKKNLTLVLALIFGALFQVNAQFTGSEIYVLDLTIDGVTTTYKEDGCGFSAPDTWGGPIDAEICLPVVWGYDISVPTDSLGCDSIANDYTGKMVMIRRGVCEFGAKALNAEVAGAAAVAIANGYAANHGDGCAVPAMGPGAKGPLVTVPTLMFCRNLIDVIDAALKAGKQPVICFRYLSLHSPSAEYTHAIPVTQADTMGTFTISIKNRTGIGQDFTARAEITDPAGNVDVLEATQFIDVDGDSIIGLPLYVPVPQIGTFHVAYSSDVANEPGDTVYRDFIMTPHTFATDNLKLNGGAANNTSFAAGDLTYRASALYRTGPNGMTVKNVTFGINNAAAVTSPIAGANNVNIILLDADVDGDGITNLGTGVEAFNATNNPGLAFIAFNDFEFNATTPVDSLIDVELASIVGDKVDLLPNHFYYVVLAYDGKLADSGIQLSFTVSQDANYDIVFDGNSVTPITLDDFYSGWGGATVVARLHDEARDPLNPVGVKPELLSKTKFSVTPNPAVDYTNVNLQLAEQNKTVVVTLFDQTGRIVSTKSVKNFQNGQIQMDTRTLPSGNYGIGIRTSEEGSAMLNVMICH